MSDHFYMSNGVRQGSISSPKLFSVYINVNDVLDALVKSTIECHLENVCLNHVMYTDDIYLIKSSPEALQKLLNMCCDFSIGNNLSLNNDNDMLRQMRIHYTKTNSLLRLFNSCFTDVKSGDFSYLMYLFLLLIFIDSLQKSTHMKLRGS